MIIPKSDIFLATEFFARHRKNENGSDWNRISDRRQLTTRITDLRGLNTLRQAALMRCMRLSALDNECDRDKEGKRLVYAEARSRSLANQSKKKV